MTTMDILRRTKAAWPSICNASAEDKNRILSAMADSLQAECDAILRCNAEDNTDLAPFCLLTSQQVVIFPCIFKCSVILRTIVDTFICQVNFRCIIYFNGNRNRRKFFCRI